MNMPVITERKYATEQDFKDSPRFEQVEFACKCKKCSGRKMPRVELRFLRFLNEVRELFAAPMKITSGFRCSQHPIEKRKSRPGAHNRGAVDIQVRGNAAYRLMHIAQDVAQEHRLPLRIGVSQKGHNRFLHFDCSERSDHKTCRLWSY